MSRRWVPFLLCLGMAIVPLLALGGTHGGATTSVYASANLLGGRGAASRTSRSASLRSFDQPFGFDVAAVPAAPPQSGLAATDSAAVLAADAAAVPATPPHPVVVRKASAPAARPTVHRTASPPPPPAPPRPSQTGPASWYGAPAGTCAHPSLPIGTLVTVTNLANGRTTTCRVEDRGPYQGGRIIDLSESTFSQLAPPASGVIEVRISW
jgi:rare lipoprotein A